MIINAGLRQAKPDLQGPTDKPVAWTDKQLTTRVGVKLERERRNPQGIR
jgi:hypothetical protein